MARKLLGTSRFLRLLRVRFMWRCRFFTSAHLWTLSYGRPWNCYRNGRCRRQRRKRSWWHWYWSWNSSSCGQNIRRVCCCWIDNYGLCGWQSRSRRIDLRIWWRWFVNPGWKRLGDSWWGLSMEERRLSNDIRILTWVAEGGISGGAERLGGDRLFWAADVCVLAEAPRCLCCLCLLLEGAVCWRDCPFERCWPPCWLAVAVACVLCRPRLNKVPGCLRVSLKCWAGSLFGLVHKMISYLILILSSWNPFSNRRGSYSLLGELVKLARGSTLKIISNTTY